jgi:predicted ATPase
MSKLRIKNFGPIKEGIQTNDGWLDIKKVTVFIGNQGSGKSTVAKIISTFTWIEKALVRGDFNKESLEKKNKLKTQFLNYHRLENYFNLNGGDKSVIEYKGEAFNITYESGSLIIEEAKNKAYPLPQIMYVPAERNFIAYVKTPKELKLSSASLKEFLTEYDNAKNALKGLLQLPINNTELEFDKLNDIINLKGDGFKVKLTEASSGFQSLVPLYLVSHYLAHSVKEQSELNKEPMSNEEMQRFKKGVEDIWNNESLTDEQKRIALSVLSAKFNKTAFINIVEEPEQNLYPTSQQQMLHSLLEFNNMNPGNKLIITTHSPYLINYLSLAVKTHTLKTKSTEEEVLKKLNKIVPLKSTINSEDLVIYEFKEADGTIKQVDFEFGLPSDTNELNQRLDDSNEMFAQLLEIQQEL